MALLAPIRESQFVLRDRVKLAASDTEFEQALSNMAYAQLSSRAPRLFNYAVAFQVVDQSDDRNKAFGVFVFKAGDKWLQVPVFYENGQIEGTEILIVDPDEYFPLTEESVNFFMTSVDARRTGRPTDRRVSQRYSAPNLWQLNTPPTKWSSADRDTALGLRTIARSRKAPQPLPQVPTLEDAIHGRPKLAAALARLVTSRPVVADMLARVIDREKMAAAVRAAADAAVTPTIFARRAVGKSTSVKAAAMLTVIRMSQTSYRVRSLGDGLAPADRSTLLSGSNVYRDGRPDDWVTHVVDWGVEGSPGQSMNPSSGTRVQKVFMPDGSTEDCIVASAPAAPGGRADGMVLVVRKSDNACAFVPRNDVWVEGTDPDEYREWVDKLPEAGEPDSLPDHFVLVSPDRQMSVPLRKGDRAGPEGVTVYPQLADFEPQTWVIPTRKSVVPGIDADFFGRFHGRRDILDGERTKRVARTPGRAGRFVLTDNCVYYPNGTKVLAVPSGKSIEFGGWNKAVDPVDNRVRKVSSAEGHDLLTVEKAGSRFRVVIGFRAFDSDRPADAEADLVEHLGLRPADAGRLVKQATAHPLGRARVAVKLAAPQLPTMTDRGPDAPGFPVDFNSFGGGSLLDGVPIAPQVSASLSVDSLIPNTADRERNRPWPFERGLMVDPAGIQPGGPESDPEVMGLLQSAAQSGKKEIVDATALAGLLKHNDALDVISKLLGPMRKVISSLGSLLMHMYWNKDAYEERYGRSESTNLRDQVRGQFTGLGKLYLGLREKSSDQVVSETSVLPNMGEADTGGPA